MGAGHLGPAGPKLGPMALVGSDVIPFIAGVIVTEVPPLLIAPL